MDPAVLASLGEQYTGWTAVVVGGWSFKDDAKEEVRSQRAWTAQAPPRSVASPELHMIPALRRRDAWSLPQRSQLTLASPPR